MKRILIDFSPFLVRSALVEDNKLVELIVDDYNNHSLTGNIYAAMVTDVVKNQFAFCDIGENKKGFLQFGDFRQRGLQDKPAQSGKQVLVQVVRDAIDEKGPYLSSELSFSSKTAVLVKNLDQSSSVKVSRKIADDNTKRILLQAGNDLCPAGYSLIIRTQAQDLPLEEVKNDIQRLHKQAEQVLHQADYCKAPLKLYGSSRIYAKTLQELLDTNPDEIIINTDTELQHIYEITDVYSGFDRDNIRFHTGGLTLFGAYQIESQAEKALNTKIWLDSGGFLLIEQAETCTFFDVNTGKAVGKKGFEQTAHAVNMEAAKEIARQIRLKNISGFFIVDFISTKSDDHEAQLKAFFKESLKNDRNPAMIADWSHLNIVQLTRKKPRLPLARQLTQNCPCCNGTGKIKAQTYEADRAYKEIERIVAAGFFDMIEVTAGGAFINILNEGSMKATLEEKYNCEIVLKPDPKYHNKPYKLTKYKKGD